MADVKVRDCVEMYKTVVLFKINNNLTICLVCSQ